MESSRDSYARVTARPVHRLTDSRTDRGARFALAGCDEAQAMSKLRRVRQVEMVRNAWRDLSGFSDLETNLLDLSVLADSAIHAALDFAVGALAPRYGKPVDDSGVFLPLPIDSGSCR